MLIGGVTSAHFGAACVRAQKAEAALAEAQCELAELRAQLHVHEEAAKREKERKNQAAFYDQGKLISSESVELSTERLLSSQASHLHKQYRGWAGEIARHVGSSCTLAVPNDWAMAPRCALSSHDMRRLFRCTHWIVLRQAQTPLVCVLL